MRHIVELFGLGEGDRSVIIAVDRDEVVVGPAYYNQQTRAYELNGGRFDKADATTMAVLIYHLFESGEADRRYATRDGTIALVGAWHVEWFTRDLRLRCLTTGTVFHVSRYNARTFARMLAVAVTTFDDSNIPEALKPLVMLAREEGERASR